MIAFIIMISSLKLSVRRCDPTSFNNELILPERFFFDFWICDSEEF